MSFSIEIEQKRHVSVLNLSGRVTLGEATNKLRETVTAELANGHKNIILNMSGVSYVDSAGLGALVFLHTHAVRENGRVKLVGLSATVINLLQLTKLSTVFDIFESEPLAVLSFE